MDGVYLPSAGVVPYWNNQAAPGLEGDATPWRMAEVALIEVARSVLATRDRAVAATGAMSAVARANMTASIAVFVDAEPLTGGPEVPW